MADSRTSIKQKKSQSKQRSIQQRFFLGTAIAISVALFLFSTVRILHEANVVRSGLEQQADRLLNISTKSLSSALWQYNDEYVADYINALSNFDDIISITVTDDQGRVQSQPHEQAASPAGSEYQPQRTILRNARIMHKGMEVGEITILFSAKRLRQLVLFNSFSMLLLMFMILVLLFITVYLISRRYIFTPLSRLEQAALKVAGGDLDQPLETESRDEIGHLATTLQTMVSSIKSITASRDDLNHEILERKRVEEKLHATVRLLQSAESIGRSGSWSFDMASGRETWSEGEYRIHGIPQSEDVSYQRHLQLVHPKDRDRHDATFQKHLQSRGNHFTQQYRIILDDETVRYVRAEYEVFRDEDGNALMVQGTDRDITDRRIVEQQRELLMSAVEQAAEAIVITDRDGNIQYVNPAFETLTGYSSKEARGNNPSILKSGKQTDQFYKGMWEVLLSGGVWSGRITNKKKSGELFDEEVSISPMKDEEGIITNFVAVKRDVSKEQALENQLRQAMKMEAIGTLTSGIAHDFNNIISAIIGYAEFIQQKAKPGSELFDGAKNILGSGQRAAELVRQLLTFSRKVEDEQIPLDLQVVIKDSLKMMRATLPSSVLVEMELADSATVVANPINIHQIIINLCTNAVHSMPDSTGTITITLEDIHRTAPGNLTGQDTAKDYVLLRISDTGCGMNQATAQRIFEPYFTTKDVGKGTGLGLSVVHGIVENCGGFIEVDSQLELGTTFSIYFPASKEKATKTIILQPDTQSSRDSGNEHVMVVDDEPLLVKINQRRLEEIGYKVSIFTDSKKALAAFQEQPANYDVLVTDQTMPGLTGMNLAKKVLELRPEIPIIMCTGHSETVSKETALEAGIKKFVAKPLQSDELLSAVAEVLQEVTADHNDALQPHYNPT